MFTDFQLMITDHPATDTKTFSAAWREATEKKFISHQVDNFYFEQYPLHVKRQIRQQFAAAMKYDLVLMKHCLLQLDQLFGEPNSSFYTDYEIWSPTGITKFAYPQKLSDSSQLVFDFYTMKESYAELKKGGPLGSNYVKYEPMPFIDNSAERELSNASRNLPGIMERVKYPCKKKCNITCIRCSGEEFMLRDVIMGLNDKCKWSREEIADWLDEISDPTGVNGPDLTFKTNIKEIKNV